MTSTPLDRKEFTNRLFVREMVLRHALTVPNWEECSTDLLAAQGLTVADIKHDMRIRALNLSYVPTVFSAVPVMLWCITHKDFAIPGLASVLLSSCTYSGVILMLQRRRCIPSESASAIAGSLVVMISSFTCCLSLSDTIVKQTIHEGYSVLFEIGGSIIAIASALLLVRINRSLAHPPAHKLTTKGKARAEPASKAIPIQTESN